MSRSKPALPSIDAELAPTPRPRLDLKALKLRETLDDAAVEANSRTIGARWGASTSLPQGSVAETGVAEPGLSEPSLSESGMPASDMIAPGLAKSPPSSSDLDKPDLDKSKGDKSRGDKPAGGGRGAAASRMGDASPEPDAAPALASLRLEIPDYLDYALTLKAAQTRVTKAFLVMQALAEAGYRIEPQDLVPDRRKARARK